MDPLVKPPGFEDIPHQGDLNSVTERAAGAKKYKIVNFINENVCFLYTSEKIRLRRAQTTDRNLTAKFSKGNFIKNPA